MEQDQLTAIEAVEAERQRALVAADRAALERILSEDLIHVHSTAMVHGKSDLIDHVCRMGGFISIERGPVDIRIFGDGALIIGRTVNRVRSRETGQELALEGMATIALRREDGVWRVLLSQLTPDRKHNG